MDASNCEVVIARREVEGGIVWRRVESTFPPTPPCLLDSRWNALREEANAIGTPLWDSTLYRFEGFERNDSSSTLCVSTISFKEALVWAIDEVRDVSRVPRPLSAVVLPKTSDDLYILGRRAKSIVYSSGEYCLLGGILSEDEVKVEEAKDLEVALRKELFEEANILPSATSNFNLQGAIQTTRGGIVLAFSCHIECTLEVVKKNFFSKNDGELISIEGVTLEELPRVMCKGPIEMQLMQGFFQE